MDRQRPQRVVVVDSRTDRLGGAVTVGSLAGTIGLDADLTPRYSGVSLLLRMSDASYIVEPPAERFVDACIQLFRRLKGHESPPDRLPGSIPDRLLGRPPGIARAIAYHSRLRRGGRRRSVTGSTATLYSAPCRECRDADDIECPRTTTLRGHVALVNRRAIWGRLGSLRMPGREQCRCPSGLHRGGVVRCGLAWGRLFGVRC